MRGPQRPLTVNGPFSQRRGALLFLGGWMLAGVFVAALLVLFGQAAWPNSLLLALPVMLVYALAAGNSAYYLCRAYPLADRSMVRIVLVLGAAALCSGGLWLGLVQLWNMLNLSFGRSWAGIHIDSALSLLLAGLGALLYGLSAVLQYLLMEVERAAAAEQRGLQAALAAQDAELRLLRTQIEPHFLFNSLNSISALTSQNPAAARKMTLQLADFFRTSLGLAGHDSIALRRELDLCRNFLAIEQVRFGARLSVEEAIEAAALDCMVPPMLIQPLVENAVKHGVAQLIEGGTVRIAARRSGAYLYLSIRNDIDSALPAASAGGMGLANVRQRLAGLYGEQARCTINRGAGYFSVDIILPAAMAAAEEEQP